MSRSPLEFIRHIDAELKFSQKVSEGLTEESFSGDEVKKRAFARSLEIIGEATKQLGNDFTVKYPNVPWTYMAKLRDKLIHHYFGIDYQMVFQIVVEKLPEVREEISRILERE